MFFLRVFCLFCIPVLAWATPRVVVTLKPIHSLVAGVMEGIESPALLLPDGASPHTFQLKPSTLKQLHDANLIIWVGPSLETFMAKSMDNFSTKQQVLTLSTLKKLNTLPIRHGREWATSHHHDHSHDNDDIDPHLWLDTDNAKVIVEAVADELIKLDPSHATQYRTNAEKQKAMLTTLKSSLQTTLVPVQSKPFLVYHDGYQYFEKEFHLNAKGAMLINPHVPLSAYGLNAIKNQIASESIKCVFRETEFNDKLILKSLQGLSIKVVELDPLGVRHPAGLKNYELTLKDLAKNMRECLE